MPARSVQSIMAWLASRSLKHTHHEQPTRPERRRFCHLATDRADDGRQPRDRPSGLQQRGGRGHGGGFPQWRDGAGVGRHPVGAARSAAFHAATQAHAAAHRPLGRRAKPVPLLVGGASAGGAGAAGFQHLPDLDGAVGQLDLPPGPGARPLAGHAGDFAGSGAGARRAGCYIRAGCFSSMVTHWRRCGLCAGGGLHFRPGAGDHPT